MAPRAKNKKAAATGEWSQQAPRPGSRQQQVNPLLSSDCQTEKDVSSASGSDLNACKQHLSVTLQALSVLENNPGATEDL